MSDESRSQNASAPPEGAVPVADGAAAFPVIVEAALQELPLAAMLPHVLVAGAAPLASTLPTLLFAFTWFRTVGEEWVTLLDDGDPGCEQKTLYNGGDQTIVFEVTWTDGHVEISRRFEVAPKSSVIIECAVARIRVAGPSGQRGAWRVEKNAPWIRLSGSGTAFSHGGDTGIGYLTCRTFEIRNRGRKKMKVNMRRATGETEPDVESTTTVHPGNTLTVRCEIVHLDIEREEGDESGIAEVREIRSDD